MARATKCLLLLWEMALNRSLGHAALLLEPKLVLAFEPRFPETVRHKSVMLYGFLGNCKGLKLRSHTINFLYFARFLENISVANVILKRNIPTTFCLSLFLHNIIYHMVHLGGVRKVCASGLP